MGQKSGKEEAVRGQAGGSEGGCGGEWSGDRNYGNSGVAAGADEPEAGIAEGGGSGVGDECHGFSGMQLRDQCRRQCLLVLFPVGAAGLAEFETGEQFAGHTGILTDHEVYLSEYFPGSGGDITEVADGGGNDVKCPRGNGRGGKGGSCIAGFQELDGGAVTRLRKWSRVLLHPYRGRCPPRSAVVSRGSRNHPRWR